MTLTVIAEQSNSTVFAITGTDCVNQLHIIRQSLNQKLVLGREDFKGKIEQMIKQQTRPGQPGRPPRVEEEAGIYYIL